MYVHVYDQEALHTRVLTSQRIKFATYAITINPRLEIHPMYMDPNSRAFHGILTSRICLSSHNLAIE
jgi:hypothetical protein